MTLITHLASRCMRWIDARLPITAAYKKHMSEYYAPKNLNIWYFFGVFSLLIFANQILSGLWLTMSFTPTEAGAFSSVELMMRDVEYGWLIRYMHSTGASFFFIVIYLHIFRGILYGSYKSPRELVWLIGMLMYFLLMAEAFLGYVLPWGQMSYWGAQVIISLFGAIPMIGEDLATWIRGDFFVSGTTLNRFFALHVIALPLLLVGLVVLHILALHEVGSNNPEGIEIKKLKNSAGRPLDGIPFHPYYTIHDLQGVVVFLFIFCAAIFFWPEGNGYFLEAANFEPANRLKTPEHIAPVWYFGAFYSILRAIPDKLLGVIAMGSAVLIPCFLPWLDRSPVRSWRYKGQSSRAAILTFAAAFLLLTWLGTQPATGTYLIAARIAACIYFMFFLLMPLYTTFETSKPVPDRIPNR